MERFAAAVGRAMVKDSVMKHKNASVFFATELL